MELENSTKFHLIEITLISAQQLKLISSNMQTYAVMWIDPNEKLKSGVDVTGHTNPTWNDKFIFLLQDQVINNANSTLVVEIYALRSFLRDKKIGVVRVFLDSLIGTSNRFYEGIQGTFRAYQVRRPSGKPQGMLNIGVILLDGVFDSIMVNESMSLSPIISGREEGMGRTKSKEIVKKGKIILQGVKKLVYKLMPKERKPKKIHQWPYSYS